MKKRVLFMIAGLTLVLLSQAMAQVDTVWTRLCPSGNYASGIARDPQENAVVVGAEGGPLSATTLLIKYKPSGDTLWLRKYFNSNDVTDYPQGVAVDKLGNIYVAGWCFPGGFPNMNWLVIKFSPSGDTLWTRRYTAGQNGDFAQSVAVDTAGYVYVTGEEYISSVSTCFTIKYSPLGDTLWTRPYSGAGYGNGIKTDASGNAYVAADNQVIKYSPSGNLLWQSIPAGATATLTGVALDSSGNVYASGGSGILVKYSPQGDTLLWSRSIAAAGWNNGIDVDAAGNAYLTGVATSDYVTMKCSTSGDSLWSVTYPGAAGTAGGGIVLADSGYFYVTATYGNGAQFLTIKYHERPSGVEEKNQNAKCKLQIANIKITPNPFVSFARVPGHEAESFSLYDVSGRKVGVFKGNRIGEGLAPGVYFLRGEDKAGRPVRVVKVR